VLRGVLAGYDGLFTRFTATATTPGPVTVILSGNRPTATVAAETTRLCAIDGRLPDLTAEPPPSVHLMPLVSQSWSPTFHYFEDGVLPEPDRAKLRDLVALCFRRQPAGPGTAGSIPALIPAPAPRSRPPSEPRSASRSQAPPEERRSSPQSQGLRLSRRAAAMENSGSL
jgi:hypothetical protein